MTSLSSAEIASLTVASKRCFRTVWPTARESFARAELIRGRELPWESSAASCQTPTGRSPPIL